MSAGSLYQSALPLALNLTPWRLFAVLIGRDERIRDSDISNPYQIRVTAQTLAIVGAESAQYQPGCQQ